MARGGTEERIHALESLRADPVSEASIERLRKALRDRSNLVAAKAASFIEEFEIQVLGAEAAELFVRYLDGGAEKDPQCWAKNALVKALKRLNHQDHELYLRGLSYTQKEPVWGGSEDTAVTLRGECALALVQCRGLSDFDVLEKLVEAWADESAQVRGNIARAVGAVERRESALLLMTKVLAGDSEPVVIGECFSGLLDLRGGGSLPFLRRFLKSGKEDVAWEAMSALAASKAPEAFEELMGVIRAGSLFEAGRAVEALAPQGAREAVRKRVQEVVEARGEAALSRLFTREFRRG